MCELHCLFGWRRSTVSLLTMLYTGLSSSCFALKTAAQMVPTELENTRLRREVVVLVMGLTQVRVDLGAGQGGA